MNDVQRIMTSYGVDEGTAREALSLAPASAILKGTSGNGVTIPGWLLSGVIAFGFGAILGPAFYGASEAGALRMKEIAEKKIRG